MKTARINFRVISDGRPGRAILLVAHANVGNDEADGRKYREWQAQQLINSVDILPRPLAQKG